MHRNNIRQMYCIVCTKPIPEGRRKDSVTCSKECSKARRDHQRSLDDQVKCRYCNKPSSPEARASFQRWKKWEKEQNAVAAD